MIQALEQVVNHASDLNHEWGPFLFLRPARHEPMTSARVGALAALYGIFAGLFVNAVVRVTGDHAESLSPYLFPLGATLGFFAIYRLTFALAWNRRAERLARGERE